MKSFTPDPNRSFWKPDPDTQFVAVDHKLTSSSRRNIWTFNLTKLLWYSYESYIYIEKCVFFGTWTISKEFKDQMWFLQLVQKLISFLTIFDVLLIYICLFVLISLADPLWRTFKIIERQFLAYKNPQKNICQTILHKLFLVFSSFLLWVWVGVFFSDQCDFWKKNMSFLDRSLNLIVFPSYTIKFVERYNK